MEYNTKVQKKVAGDTKTKQKRNSTVRIVWGDHQVYLYGHFMFGEGSAPQELVYAMDGKESCDVGTEVISNCHSHCMCCNHLRQHKHPLNISLDAMIVQLHLHLRYSADVLSITTKSPLLLLCSTDGKHAILKVIC